MCRHVLCHWNTTTACGTASTCIITTIACSSCGATANQCTNTTAFGTATAPTTLNTTTTISSCSYQTEYSTINSVVAGRIYRVEGPAGTFITVRQGTSSGTVIASGLTPLTFTSTVAGTYYSHWNTTTACGTASTCIVTTITYVGNSPCATPANDLCANAIPISCGVTVNGSTNTATSDAALGNCAIGAGGVPNNGIWYSLAGVSGATTVSLCGSSYDTKLHVYSGSCGTLTCVASSDDFCGLQSEVSFTASAGVTYYVLVNGFGSNTGAFTLLATCTQIPAPCNSATVVTGALPQTVSLNCPGTNLITSANYLACGSSLYVGGQEAVVSYTPPTTGSYNFAYTGQTYTGIFVYSGCPLVAGSTCVTNVTGSGSSKNVSATLTAGVTYYIVVDTWPSPPSPCPGTLTISAATPPPANDVCTGATPITCGTPITGNTSSASLDAVGTCGTTLNTAPGLWYSLAGFNGEVIASLCGSGYDTKIGVFTGSCGALTCLTGNDDFCGLQSQVTFSTVAGTTYYILVTGFSTNAGAFTLNTTCTTCAAPTGVTVTGVTATTATVNWNCVGCTGSFIVEYGPSATFTTPGTGATAGVGGTVVTAAGSPALLTGLTAGTQYRVFVRQNCAGSFSNNTTGVLFNTPPANDNVCSAIPLVLGANPPYSNAGATTEAGEPVPPGIACSVQNGWCAGQTVSNSVWFTLVGPPSGRVTVSSTGFDNQLAIYAAASCSAVLSGGATLLAANDDFNPGFAASLNNVCVTPGVTYYVQMDGYATATGTATITVIEVPNTPPTIAGCPANITSCSPLVSWTAPTANDPDGCGTPTLTSTHAPGSVFGPGLTTVTYTATDHAGATATCSFTVNVATITASVSSVSNYNGFGVSCNGGNNGSATVTASGGTGLTYNWSNGATGATANGLSAGNYTVVVSNAQGCSQTLLVSITQPTAVTCSASSTNVGCNDAATGTASASATGGVGPYTFNWSNGATGANISGLAAGSYTVTVADANGCVCTRTVTITQPTAVQLVSEGVVVDGSGGSFYSVYQIVVTGGTLPYNIAFTSAGGFATYTVNNGLVDTDGNGTPDAPGATINVTYQNEAQWTLILDDANGCVAGAGLVFSNAGPNALLNIASAAIVADSGTGNGSISIVASGGVPTCPGYNYQWSGPSNWLGASVNSPNISNLPSGWYIVVVTDCSGEQTYAWYWVPKQTRGRGKLAQGETIMAYPNPVNSQTTIEFSLDVTAKTTVSVYALDGKEVAQLYNGTAEAGELYTIPFDVSYLPNGVYMATLRTDNGFTQQIKLTVMH